MLCTLCRTTGSIDRSRRSLLPSMYRACHDDSARRARLRKPLGNMRLLLALYSCFFFFRFLYAVLDSSNVERSDIPLRRWFPPSLLINITVSNRAAIFYSRFNLDSLDVRSSARTISMHIEFREDMPCCSSARIQPRRDEKRERDRKNP